MFIVVLVKFYSLLYVSPLLDPVAFVLVTKFKTTSQYSNAKCLDQ